MEEQTQAPAQSVEVQQTTGQSLTPHRGVLILVLGILGILCCFICGIVAWVMGNGDLKEMAAGRMDPTGEGLTKAGKICGIVSVVLLIVGIILNLIFMLLGFGLFAVSGGPRTM
ncbi:MAG: hypothetical protein ACYSWZ_23785 [Planctomycetota bacterium]|jgi:hypothetical protein